MTRPVADSDNNRPLRILGVDPGLRRTGYAVLTCSPGNVQLCEAGVITLAPRDSLAQRLLELESQFATVIAQHRPAALACEELFSHYRQPRTAILMAHARGVILLNGAKFGLTVISTPAKAVKKFLTGSGQASKPQMQRAVQATLGLSALPEPHDIADAVAIALCGLATWTGGAAAAAASA